MVKSNNKYSKKVDGRKNIYEWRETDVNRNRKIVNGDGRGNALLGVRIFKQILEGRNIDKVIL